MIYGDRPSEFSDLLVKYSDKGLEKAREFLPQSTQRPQRWKGKKRKEEERKIGTRSNTEETDGKGKGKGGGKRILMAGCD